MSVTSTKPRTTTLRRGVFRALLIATYISRTGTGKRIHGHDLDRLHAINELTKKNSQISPFFGYYPSSAGTSFDCTLAFVERHDGLSVVESERGVGGFIRRTKV